MLSRNFVLFQLSLILTILICNNFVATSLPIKRSPISLDKRERCVWWPCYSSGSVTGDINGDGDHYGIGYTNPGGSSSIGSISSSA
ncbi:2391_t:CDS:2 [Ambispora leptoticha]|uniref:2391_t:CDS:1 n=1 Tax=Ambispora leptoticha TaxID=144679 RepID=A0A9N9G8K6_9GLOM|nr:2391_t:CDS:2 [Ambispora leptoticha]